MDPETQKIIGSLGIGGILAWGMFMIYRKDSISWQEAWKGQSQMLVQVVKENTAAVTALIEKLNHQNEWNGTGRRKGDQ